MQKFLEKFGWIVFIVSGLSLLVMICIGQPEVPEFAFVFAIMLFLVFGIIEKFQQVAFMERWAQQLENDE